MKQAGEQLPTFSLTSVRGDRVTSDSFRDGAILVFFKIECPTCQYTLPFLERLHKSGANVIGVAQNDAKQTESFANQYGLSFPLLIDAPDYKVSKAFALSTVPTMFAVRNGNVEFASDGWVRKDFEKLAERARAAAPVFKPQESVLDFKAG